MKIGCISDLHGYLPSIDQCDILIIAGDICPVSNHYLNYQLSWLNTEFRKWLDNLSVTKVIAIAGNHDFIFEKNPQLVPKLNWTYLQDNFIYSHSLKIYGLPWQRRFYDWAFNLDEPELDKKYEQIPNDTNIIISHGPVYGYGDKVPRKITDENEETEEVLLAEHVGNRKFRERIMKTGPKLVVYGHIHSGYGQYKYFDSMLINASLVNENYEPVNKPIYVEI